jgi:hypothetical protein
LIYAKKRQARVKRISFTRLETAKPPIKKMNSRRPRRPRRRLRSSKSSIDTKTIRSTKRKFRALEAIAANIGKLAAPEIYFPAVFALDRSR